MALTAAEKQKRYRERLNADPERRNEFLRKMRDHARKRKDLKLDKPIKELSGREQRRKRKYWQDKQRKCRQKKQDEQRQLDHIMTNTPPNTPPPGLPPVLQNSASIRGRKRLRKDRSAAYRRIAKLEEALEGARKKINKYKSKVQRLKTKVSDTPSTSKSPLSKLNRELADLVVPQPVRKKLLFQDVLLTELKNTYKCTPSEKIKQTLSQICKGPNVKKYKFVAKASKKLGFRSDNSKKDIQRNRINKLRKKVRDFYCRDDNSQQTPGKKQTVTFRGLKKQKRFLLQSVINLHKKFCKEFNVNLGKSTFFKWRPFYVVQAKLSERDSCLCKKHDNLQKKLDTIIRENLVDSADLETLCGTVKCDTNSISCMLNKCQVCKDKNAITKEIYFNKKVKWFVWKTERNVIEKEGKTQQISKTVKNQEEGYLQDLITVFNKEFKEQFCPHVFRIRHQFKQSQICKSELCYDEAAVHIDFSENYICKLGTEIQAMHFGASHNQATLQTVVVYLENGEHQSYCTVSDSRRHNPAAVWAHLMPILLELKSKNIDVIHFFSDGPASQYKNKDNFFYFKTLFHQIGFKCGTWNFSEAAHGKGAPDGIGAAVKRIADNLVARGTDVGDAKAFFEQVRKKTELIKMFFISECDITDMDHKKDGITIKKIPGIMKVHQVLSLDRESTLYIREFSCFCKKLPVLDLNCFNSKEIKVFEHENPTINIEAKEIIEIESNTAKEDLYSDSDDIPLSEIKNQIRSSLHPITIGNFVICKFTYNEGTKHEMEKRFVALILGVEDDMSYLVDCLRKRKNEFVFPNIEDKNIVKPENICCVLSDPKIKRGCYDFGQSIPQEMALF